MHSFCCHRRSGSCLGAYAARRIVHVSRNINCFDVRRLILFNGCGSGKSSARHGSSWPLLFAVLRPDTNLGHGVRVVPALTLSQCRHPCPQAQQGRGAIQSRSMSSCSGIPGQVQDRLGLRLLAKGSLSNLEVPESVNGNSSLCFRTGDYRTPYSATTLGHGRPVGSLSVRFFLEPHA